MTTIDVRRPRAVALTARAPLEAVGYLAIAALVVWWTWRAFHDPNPMDLGLAYNGGQLAWTTGHPETLWSWISTPFLGLILALVSQITSVNGAAHADIVINLVLVIATGGYVLRRLRGSIHIGLWWALAFAIFSFGPMMSSVWYKQFNIIALVLALGGFELIRRGHQHRGGALIGLSVGFKPMAIALPVLLLARRETRRAGLWSLVWLAGPNIVGQAFMAWRAHSISALNLIPVLNNFSHKSTPGFMGWPCDVYNFAPGSLLCRLVGQGNWTVQNLIVYAFVALLALWAFDALRGRGAFEWDGFAFTCALSVMIGPIAWSHYQIMLAPLFVLLVYRFTHEGAAVAAWLGLLAAFFLASLMWAPYGTMLTSMRHLVSSKVMTFNDLTSIEAVAEFAQYVLILTGIIWYTGSRTRFEAMSTLRRLTVRGA